MIPVDAEALARVRADIAYLGQIAGRATHEIDDTAYNHVLCLSRRIQETLDAALARPEPLERLEDGSIQVPGGNSPDVIVMPMDPPGWCYLEFGTDEGMQFATVLNSQRSTAVALAILALATPETAGGETDGD